MNRATPSMWAVAGIAALIIAAASVGATALTLAPTRPAALAPGSDPETFPLTAQDFIDQRTVDVTVNTTDGTSLVAPAAGRITAWACAAGSSLASGSTLLSIDDQPVLALATSMPLWRDLAPGDRGADVESLQAELVRLGKPVTVDGRLGPQTLAALDDLFDAIGDTTDLEAVPLARILWLPAAAVTLGGCTATLGDRLDEGDKIAFLPGGVTQLVIENYPDDLYPGDRVVVIDDVDVPVDPQGRVSSDGIALIGGIALTRSTEGDEPATFSAALHLVDIIAVAPVPPSALYDLEGDRGCVTSGGALHAVTVAGSQLGETFVVFENGRMPASVDVTPRGTPPCR